MLTDIKVRALKPGTSVKRLRDNSADPLLRGFGVLVTPAGGKSFFLAYTSPETNARRYLNLGAYSAVSLAEARERAREARKLVGRGIDPIEECARIEQAEKEDAERAAALGTVSQLFEFYIADLEADQKRSAKDVRAAYDRDIGPVLGHLKAGDVTADQCADLLTDIATGSRPAYACGQSQRQRKPSARLADQTRSYLHAAFEFGRAAKKMPRWRRKVPTFDIGHNPVADIRKAAPGSRARDRFLDKNEFRTFWVSIGESREINIKGGKKEVSLDPLTALALKFSAATGQRVEEVLGARWDEFDLAEKLWSIPGERRKMRRKNREPHIVPLADLHLQLLKEIRELSPTGYLFPKLKRDDSDPDMPRPTTSLAQAVRRFCARTDMTPFQPRDLRRTWKTLAGAAGIDLELRNRIQGHALQDVASVHYDRYAYLREKRHAMEKWAIWLQAMLADEPARVIDLPIAKAQ